MKPSQLGGLLLFLICILFFSLQTHTVDQIEQDQRQQAECQYRQEWTYIPQLWHCHSSQVGNLGNLRKHLLVSQAKNHCSSQETKQTRHQIIQFSFAGPGDTGAWSVSHQGHAYPED